MDYLWLKWIHILSSTLLFGTGLGIAFFLWVAHLRGDARVIASTARTVVIADACFTAPAVIVQLVTDRGFLVACLGGAVLRGRRLLAAGAVAAAAGAGSGA
jgi:uncharacterized membrane protein